MKMFFTVVSILWLSDLRYFSFTIEGLPVSTWLTYASFFCLIFMLLQRLWDGLEEETRQDILKNSAKDKTK